MSFPAIILDLPQQRESVTLAAGYRLDLPAVVVHRAAAGDSGMEDLSGWAIRGFELGERIGKRGHGAVYRAVPPHARDAGRA